MFNSYFFAKFAFVVVGLAVSPAILSLHQMIGAPPATVKAAVGPATKIPVSQHLRTQRLRLRVARLSGEAVALTQQNLELRQLNSQAAAQKKVAEIAIADLKTKLSRAEASAYAKYQGEVTVMSDRLQEYVTQSETNLATVKSGLEIVQTGLQQALKQSRHAIARGIVKRRLHRADQRTIAALQLELSKSQDALKLAMATPAPQAASTSPPANAPQTVAASGPAQLSAGGPGTMPPASGLGASEKQLAAEKPKPVKRKPVRQTESSGFSFFP